MKRTKKKRASKPAARVVVYEDDDEREEALDPVDLALSEFGEDEELKLLVKRYNETDGVWGYLKQVPFQREAHSLDWIRNRWGPGRYLLVFKSPERTRSKIFDIEPDEPERSKRSEPERTSSDRFLEYVEKQNQVLFQALLANRAASAPSSSENPIVLKLLEGMQSANVEFMKAAFVQRAADGMKPDAIDKALGLFEKGMEIAQELKGGSGDDGFAGVLRTALKELGPAIGEVVKQQRARGPVIVSEPRPIGSLPAGGNAAKPPGAAGIETPFSRAGSAADPSGAVRTSPVPAPASSSASSSMEAQPVTTPPGAMDFRGSAAATGSLVPDEETFLRSLVAEAGPELVGAASRGESGEDVGDWILQNVPMALWPALAKLDADRVTAMEPRLSSHRAFVEDAVRYIRENAEESPE